MRWSIHAAFMTRYDARCSLRTSAGLTHHFPIFFSQELQHRKLCCQYSTVQVLRKKSQLLCPNIHLLVGFFPYLSIIGKMWRNTPWYISYSILNFINYTIFIIGHSKETTSLKKKVKKHTLNEQRAWTRSKLEWKRKVHINIQWDSQKTAMTLKSTSWIGVLSATISHAKNFKCRFLSWQLTKAVKKLETQINSSWSPSN